MPSLDALFGLHDRAIVVTGGAGHLGRVFCAGLRDAGAHVLCLSSRSGEFAEESQSAKSGGSIVSEVCDVADEKAFDEALRRFVKIHGALDGLVNNAARAPRGIDFAMPADRVEEAFRGTFLHYFTCTRTALGYFKEDAGVVVNNASIWGRVSPDPRTYLDLRNEPSIPLPSAKAAVLQLTKYLAVLLAPRGVRVNALVPGFFPQRRGPDNPAYMAQINARIPMGRIGDSKELVGALIFLLSNASSYMTGQEIVVDGGYTLW